MRWFKHDSDAGNDAKLRKLRLKYGAQGYGIYWYCLELIARNVDKYNLTFQLEHDADLIADDFKLSGEFVQEMMTYMVNLCLFENIQGVITCLKMSNRTDEYTQQLMRELKYSHDKLPRTSESVPRISEVREEKRREENNKNITPLKMLMAMNVSENISKDWLKVRKLKKQAPTQTAFNKIQKHAIDNGYSFEQAIQIAIENSWAGFNVSWLSNEKTNVAEVPDWKRGML